MSFEAEVGDHVRVFEIDTGADETVAPPHIDPAYPLYKSNYRLDAAGRSPLSIIGMQKLPITYYGKTSIQEIYFIEVQKTALLGKSAIATFDLLQRTNQVSNRTTERERPEKTYADLFKGMGRMKGSYEIILWENVTPFAITTPGRVPLPLTEELKTLLDKLVAKKIVVPITERTDWVAPVVLTPKPNGKLQYVSTSHA